MTTTHQIRAEIDTVLRFKALAERLGLSQGRTLEEMVALMEKKLETMKGTNGP